MISEKFLNFHNLIILWINRKPKFVHRLLQVKENDEAANSVKDILNDIKNLFKRVDIDVFLFILFLLGANWGFLENYLFVFLDSLNAPTYMLGK